jgi:hypothetical protein
MSEERRELHAWTPGNVAERLVDAQLAGALWTPGVYQIRDVTSMNARRAQRAWLEVVATVGLEGRLLEMPQLASQVCHAPRGRQHHVIASWLEYCASGTHIALVDLTQRPVRVQAAVPLRVLTPWVLEFVEEILQWPIHLTWHAPDRVPPHLRPVVSRLQAR